MQKPESILNIDHTILDGDDTYEAYVYKYTNTINGRMYIGSRKGLFDGTYWHSSKNKEFLGRRRRDRLPGVAAIRLSDGAFVGMGIPPLGKGLGLVRWQRLRGRARRLVRL